MARVPRMFSGKRKPVKAGRMAFVKEGDNGPWGKCDWTPPIKRGQAYF